LVEFNYLFGKTHTPLILIILISTTFGGLTVGFIGMYRIYIQSKQLKQYEKEWKQRGFEPLPEPTSIFKRKPRATAIDEQHIDNEAETLTDNVEGNEKET